MTNVTIVVLAVVPTVAALAAWALWLLFNYLIAKQHGIEGIEATPPIATAFRPRDWAILIRGKGTPLSMLSADKQDPPPDEPPAPDADRTAGG